MRSLFISILFMEDKAMVPAKPRWLSVFAVLGVLLIIPFFDAYGAGEKAIKEGMTLPHFKVAGAETIDAQEYLGLKSSAPFTLSEIQAKLLLVEFYSFYCHVCMKTAPTVNKLYTYIQGQSTLRDDIKMMGIGITNKPVEVKYYRENFNVKFPLFPDEKREILDTLGIQWTPVLVVMTPDGKVLIAHYGEIDDLDGFIREIKKIHAEL